MAIDRLGGSGFDGPERVRSEAEKVSRDRPAKYDRSGDSGRVADRLEVSPQAREIAELVARAREIPEVRRETVDAIRRDLGRGTHQVDPEQLAKLVLEFEREFEG